jgi:hypothetical protein
MWNHGARFVSPMAWSGASGRDAGKPGYDPFTAWRDTPLEEAARDFLLARAGLAPGSRLWTFGAGEHADDDGWRAEHGSVEARPAHLRVAPDAGRAILVSPRELALPARTAWRVVLVTPGEEITRLQVEGRAGPDAAWAPLGGAASGVLDVRPARAVDQLRLTIEARSGVVPLARVALIPRPQADGRPR